MSEEYIYLPSNANSDLYPDNTLSKYTVELPKHYRFNENSHVSLSSLTFNYKISQLPLIDDFNGIIDVFQHVHTIWENEKQIKKFKRAFTLNLPRKAYTIQSLVETLNENVPKTFQNLFYFEVISNEKKQSYIQLSIKTFACVVYFQIQFFHWAFGKKGYQALQVLYGRQNRIACENINVNSAYGFEDYVVIENNPPKVICTRENENYEEKIERDKRKRKMNIKYKRSLSDEPQMNNNKSKREKRSPQSSLVITEEEEEEEIEQDNEEEEDIEPEPKPPEPTTIEELNELIEKQKPIPIENEKKNKYYLVDFVNWAESKIRGFNTELEQKKITPKFVRLNVNLITPCLSGTHFTTEIDMIPLINEGENFSFENIQKKYHKVRDPLVERIQISLLDENNQQLCLTSGQPTVVCLRLTKMYSNFEYITFQSNQSNDLYKSNTNSDFKCVLPYYKNYDSSWKVALSSIHLKSLFDFNNFLLSKVHEYKIQLSFQQTQYTLDNWPINKYSLLGDMSITIAEKLSQNPYEMAKVADLSDVNNLIEHISNLIQERSSLIEVRNDDGKIAIKLKEEGEIDEHQRDIKLDNITISLPPELAYFLGATDTILDDLWKHKIKAGHEYIFVSAPDYRRLLPENLLLYCNIIKPVVFGPVYAQVLKMIPLKIHDAIQMGSISYESEHLDYLDLSVPEFNTIHFTIKDLSGSNFEMSKDCLTNIVLRFQRF